MTMQTIAYYFLQVILCSGLMMGYYWLVLRNRRFHQYNRFYLLAIALLSWIIPLIKIRYGHPAVQYNQQMLQFLSVVADNNSQIEETLTRKEFQWNWEWLVTGLYITVASILLVGMLLAFFRLYRMLQNNSCKNLGSIYLILTKVKGTPFSFFRYIFWNEEIDISSETGKQILQHELTHVQQKHSYDKIFIRLVLIAGWFNPFFWLIRKEMDMIHEFIADKKAIHNGDTASLAQMLLTAAYPQQQFALTHPFFFSPIKRRIQMLTNNKNPRFSYLRRLVVLPLLAIVVVLFAFRNKNGKTETTISVAAVMQNAMNKIQVLGLSKPAHQATVYQTVLVRNYTVVIDAGHGGSDKGGIAPDGTPESQLNLQLAKTIRDLNQHENIRIVLRRDADIFQNVAAIAEQANQLKPDLFISLHVDNEMLTKPVNGKSNDSKTSGITVYLPKKETAADFEGSELLAGQLSKTLSPLSATLNIKSRDKGIWVLTAVKSPAVLVETGFLSNPDDLRKLKDPDYQKQLAAAVLQGINNYLVNPHQSVAYLHREAIADTTIKKATTPVANEGANTPALQLTAPIKLNEISKLLVILDGKKTDNQVLQSLDPNQIQSINILKSANAIVKYGEEGKDGVIEVSTKTNVKVKTTAVTLTDFQHNQNNNVQVQTKLATTQSVNVQNVSAFSQNTNDQKDEGKIIVDSVIRVKGKPLNPQPLVLVDGIKASMNSVTPDKIKSVNVLKDETAVKKYGEEGKNGVIEISTKDAVPKKQ
ncbi:MAG: hypothetical protein RLZZ28_1818 [Bacteroidota bacterium]